MPTKDTNYLGDRLMIFTLTNQDNELMNLTDFRGDVVVVAFIFTKCPDVCPIITQLLRSVDEGLTSEYQEHVSIISISVEPGV